MNIFEESVSRNQSNLCVGLDPDGVGDRFHFCREIVDKTYDLCAAYKINSAFFEASGDYDSLTRLITYISTRNIPVILDAKYSDIGNTAKQYAKSAYEYYNVQSCTVVPFFGTEGINPFLEYEDRVTFLVAAPSNKSSWISWQDIDLASDKGNTIGEEIINESQMEPNAGFVIGATNEYFLNCARQRAKDNWILVPGVGSQGGNLENSVKLLKHNFLISVSRDLYGSDTRRKALGYGDRIRQALHDV